MGYGSSTWTCGRCGDTYSASGVVGDLKVDSWAREHKEQHRVDDLPEDEKAAYYDRKIRAGLFALGKSRTPADV